jgi:hypothetical protein
MKRKIEKEKKYQDIKPKLNRTMNFEGMMSVLKKD